MIIEVDRWFILLDIMIMYYIKDIFLNHNHNIKKLSLVCFNLISLILSLQCLGVLRFLIMIFNALLLMECLNLNDQDGSFLMLLSSLFIYHVLYIQHHMCLNRFCLFFGICRFKRCYWYSMCWAFCFRNGGNI